MARQVESAAHREDELRAARREQIETLEKHRQAFVQSKLYQRLSISQA